MQVFNFLNARKLNDEVLICFNLDEHFRRDQPQLHIHGYHRSYLRTPNLTGHLWVDGHGCLLKLRPEHLSMADVRCDRNGVVDRRRSREAHPRE